jgi:hypothetical protein
MSGAYSIRAAGIYQLDKDYFLRSDGAYTLLRDWRGASTAVRVNNNWVWGWDGTVLSDRTFCRTTTPPFAIPHNGSVHADNQRSHFSAIYFRQRQS